MSAAQTTPTTVKTPATLPVESKNPSPEPDEVDEDADVEALEAVCEGTLIIVDITWVVVSAVVADPVTVITE